MFKQKRWRGVKGFLNNVKKTLHFSCMKASLKGIISNYWYIDIRQQFILNLKLRSNTFFGVVGCIEFYLYVFANNYFLLCLWGQEIVKILMLGNNLWFYWWMLPTFYSESDFEVQQHFWRYLFWAFICGPCVKFFGRYLATIYSYSDDEAI